MTSTFRGSKRVRVYNGVAGHVIATICRRVKSIIHKALSQPARELCKMIVKSEWAPKLTLLNRFTRVLAFPKEKSFELRLLIGKMTIGSLNSGSDEWQIRTPFSMFINAGKLPNWEDVLQELEHEKY